MGGWETHNLVRFLEMAIRLWPFKWLAILLGKHGSEIGLWVFTVVGVKQTQTLPFKWRAILLAKQTSEKWV